MEGHLGAFALGSLVSGIITVEDGTNGLVTPDDLPVWEVYDVDGTVVISGTSTLLRQEIILDATNASPIVIESTDHGLVEGMRVAVSEVTGNTAANGEFFVSIVDDNHFELVGSAGNGAYTGGGIWSKVGYYRYAFEATELNGFAAGGNYIVSGEASYTDDTFVLRRGGGKDTFQVV